MGAPTNLAFSTPDPTTLGQAAGWTQTTTAAAQQVGSYQVDGFGFRRRAEGFGGQWYARGTLSDEYTSNNSATIQVIGNPFSVGQIVQFVPLVFDYGLLALPTAPFNFTNGFLYFVVAAGANSVQLSASPGGTPIFASGVVGGYLYQPSVEFYLSALSVTVVPPWAGVPSAAGGLYGNGIGGSLSVESFVGWVRSGGVLATGDLTQYAVALVGASPGLYDSSTHPFDSFTGWGTAGYFVGPNVVGVNVTRGMFDTGGDAFEAFAQNWTPIAGGYFTGPNVLGTTSLQGTYDSTLTDAAETFRAVVPSQWSVVGPPTTTLTAALQAPRVGDAVHLATTGTLPGGFAVNTTYWCVASSGMTFSLSATHGGSAISATNAGSGTHSLTADPAYGWPVGGYQ